MSEATDSAPARAEEPFRLLRCLVAAVSGLLFTFLFFGSIDAWKQISAQNWDQDSLGWLRWDYLARSAPQLQFLKEALAGAALTLVLALLGEALRRRRNPVVGLIRWGSRFFGRWPGLALMVVLVWAPDGIAALTRPAARDGAPNVLFILVDTWRADHTSFLGYERETWPETAKVAEEGVIFERAVAQAPWTRPSVATCFTSLVPSKHGSLSYMPVDSGRKWVPLPLRHTTLTETLAAAGYETLAISNNFNIQPLFGFGQGCRDYRLYHWSVDAGDMAEEMQDWLDSYDEDRPFFCYLHVTDPHYPYEPPAGFAGTWDKSGIDFNIGPDTVHDFHAGNIDITPEQMQHLRDAYDEELLYTDSAIGPFIRHVRDKFPNTIIVLVGDHGDEFMDHGAIGHGHILFDELTHVPLVIWAPGVEGRRVASQVRLMDIVPTVADFAGLERPAVDMGVSLRPLMTTGEGEDLPAPMETGGDLLPPWQRRGIVMRYQGRLWKMIRDEISSVNKDGVKYGLYDLEADPKEQHNLAEEHPDIVEALFKYMIAQGWYTHPDDLEGIGEAWSGSMDDSTKENLRALGYLGGEEG
ncbi:MAG: hypothetical protein D6702_11435 [Planctomycetota bacterium]|nr:MAG: hypothetical protein D6702_11435 [Planctomycetota bacterium]